MNDILLTLEQEKGFMWLNQGGINIGQMGDLGLTPEQLRGINGLLSTIYSLNDPEIYDDNDLKHYRDWELSYIEILKNRMKEEERMINHLK